MWTCIKCNTINEDQISTCPHCGASRSAGRFGTSAQNSRNSASYAAPVRQSAPAVTPAAPRSDSASLPQAQYIADFSHVRAGRGYLILGAFLAILLPLLTVLVGIGHNDAWQSAVLALLFKTPDTLSALLGRLIYDLVVILSALITALPGLWTIFLGKTLRRLARMEELL